MSVVWWFSAVVAAFGVDYSRGQWLLDGVGVMDGRWPVVLLWRERVDGSRMKLNVERRERRVNAGKSK